MGSTSRNKKGYSRQELRVRPGLKELAAAVIEQWVLDGRPKADMPQIEIWKKVVLYDVH